MRFMRFNFLYSKKTIALDITSGAIYIAQLKACKNKYILQFAHKITIEKHAVDKGNIIDWQSIQSVLSKYVLEYGWQDFKVIIKIPSHTLYMNEITLPMGLSQTEIIQDIQRQLTFENSTLPESLAIDFQPLSVSDNHYITYAYVAIRQAYLNQYQQGMLNCNLKISIIDIDIYAMVRVLSLCFKPFILKDHLNYALVVTQYAAFLIVFSNTHIVWHKQWQLIDKVKFAASLYEQLTACSAILNKNISKLLTCVHSKYQPEMFDVCMQLQVQVEITSPFANIFNADKFAFDLQDEQYEFITTLGLALRGI